MRRALQQLRQKSPRVIPVMCTCKRMPSPHPISSTYLTIRFLWRPYHQIKYLEQLLNSSLATVAAIQFSGNTLANVLTPCAYDTNKALYALAALDIPTLSTTPRESDTPTRSTFSDIGNNSLCSSNRSPPLPNSNLVVPCTGRIVIYIYQSLRSMSYIFRWPDWRLSAVFFIFFSICLGIGKGSSCKRPFF